MPLQHFVGLCCIGLGLWVLLITAVTPVSAGLLGTTCVMAGVAVITGTPK